MFEVWAAVAAAGLGAHQETQALLTVAELSEYQATATYAEVVELLDRIQERSSIMRRAELGPTVEGRSLPLVILANPPIQTAAEARRSGKAIVFAFGNIHGGEVCGKEALLMLTRQLALDPQHRLFDDLVIVLLPILNADGNERISPDNRPGQLGPARGMGQRRNAAGLDLNRDYVKLETPETRALVRFLTEWDPHLTVDTHTTNGSRHRYALTYAAPLNPSGHPGPIAFLRDRMLPEITRRMRQARGFETFFYGNFDTDRTLWRTYSAMPRFGGPYRGLRGRMSILSEAYAYAPYRDRVLATHEFLHQILLYSAEHRAEIIEITRRAQRETIEAGLNPQPVDIVGIRHRPAALSEPAVIRGYAPGDDKTPRDFQVVFLGRFESTLGVRRPFGYLIDPGLDGVIDTLSAHGIILEPFAGNATVEAYTITDSRRASQPFEGHHLVSLKATAAIQRRRFPAGSVLVRTAQPLGTLAVYLLEPESQDGLAAWNFLDEHISPGGVYPVYRVRSQDDLAKVGPAVPAAEEGEDSPRRAAEGR
ncbi:MAG: M14 family metallopeptidase [Planctomycetes bacterium]|nr:M14 family metallopeptidase [Planctomycetota bacterium]